MKNYFQVYQFQLFTLKLSECLLWLKETSLLHSKQVHLLLFTLGKLTQAFDRQQPSELVTNSAGMRVFFHISKRDNYFQLESLLFCHTTVNENFTFQFFFFSLFNLRVVNTSIINDPISKTIVKIVCLYFLHIGYSVAYKLKIFPISEMLLNIPPNSQDRRFNYPSISARSWFIVCREYGCIGDSIRFPPTESNSSINITQGAFAFASPKDRKDSNKFNKINTFKIKLHI